MVAGIVRQIPQVKQRIDAGAVCRHICGAVDGRDAHHLAAIVADTFHALADGQAGGDRGHED